MSEDDLAKKDLLSPDASRRPDLARWCYACGDLNPIGLHLHFTIQEDGWTSAPFTADKMHQGYPGFVHGGLVTTLLDEAMGWATYGAGIWALTGKLELSFRKPVPVDETLTVRARITRDRGRLIESEADLRDASGTVLAQAKGVLLRANAEQAKLIEEQARALGAP
jgi:acyl-coenzyme A thioesterase PaaI-like protein